MVRANETGLTLAMVETICDSLHRLFRDCGMLDHPIHEVIRYDLAAHRASFNVEEAESAILEDFAYDVHGWVQEVNTYDGRPVSCYVPKSPNTVCFVKKDDTVVAVPLPDYR